jgi:fumarate hydratase subunit beta
MDVKLKTPLSRRDTSNLKVRDVAYVSGIIYTARDSAHKRIFEEGSPIDLVWSSNIPCWSHNKYL